MSKQHVLDIIQTAQGRAAAIDSTAPGFAFNKTLSMEGYHASIDAARDEVFQYIALQSRLNAQRGRMLAAGRALAEWSSRMLCAVHSTFGKDSHPYQAAAAVKSSAPRRRPRKRRSAAAAVAAGTCADKSPAARSTVREPVEDVHPVSHEGLVGKGLVDVGRDGGASTTPDVDVGDETEAVRRTEVLAPHECQASDAGPADEVEHGWEVDGAEEVAEEDVGGLKPKSVAIDAADAGRALTDALAAPGAIHEDAPLAGKDPGADVNPACTHVAEGVEDQGERDGEGGRDGLAVGAGDRAAMEGGHERPGGRGFPRIGLRGEAGPRMGDGLDVVDAWGWLCVALPGGACRGGGMWGVGGRGAGGRTPGVAKRGLARP